MIFHVKTSEESAQIKQLLGFVNRDEASADCIWDVRLKVGASTAILAVGRAIMGWAGGVRVPSRGEGRLSSQYLVEASYGRGDSSHRVADVPSCRLGHAALVVGHLDVGIEPSYSSTSTAILQMGVVGTAARRRPR